MSCYMHAGMQAQTAQARHGAPLVKADALSEVALPLASVAPPQVLLITFIGDRRRARRPLRRGQTTSSCKIGSSLALTCTCRGSSTGPSWRSSRHVKVQSRELIQLQLDHDGPGARAARRLVVVTGARCRSSRLVGTHDRCLAKRMLDRTSSRDLRRLACCAHAFLFKGDTNLSTCQSILHECLAI